MMIVGEARARTGTDDVHKRRARPEGRISAIVQNSDAIKGYRRNAPD
jgi:hypothetical protein